MNRLTPLALAAAVLASSVSILVATPAAAENSVRVRYGDLDLATSGGQAVLAHRLRRAADILCFADKTRELAPLQACRSDVLASVRPAVQLAMKGGNVRVAMGESIAVRALR